MQSRLIASVSLMSQLASALWHQGFAGSSASRRHTHTCLSFQLPEPHRGAGCCGLARASPLKYPSPKGVFAEQATTKSRPADVLRPRCQLGQQQAGHLLPASMITSTPPTGCSAGASNTHFQVGQGGRTPSARRHAPPSLNSCPPRMFPAAAWAGTTALPSPQHSNTTCKTQWVPVQVWRAPSFSLGKGSRDARSLAKLGFTQQQLTAALDLPLLQQLAAFSSVQPTALLTQADDANVLQEAGEAALASVGGQVMSTHSDVKHMVGGFAVQHVVGTPWPRIRRHLWAGRW